MQKCPSEIHALIFELACTDGGATGVALSAVSRYVRAMSAPYQWYTLAVTGTTQTVRLAERIRHFSFSSSSSSSSSSPSSSPSSLSSQPDPVEVEGKGKKLSGPTITHLFLSNRTAPRARELRYLEMGATRDMAERRRIEAVFNAKADAWARAVRVLFAYASPTLRTLSMMCYDIHVSPNGRLFFSDLRRYRFPHLEEISIRGGFDARLRDYDGTVGSSVTVRLRSAAVEGVGEDREVEEEEEGEEERRGDAKGHGGKNGEEPTLPALRRLHLASPISFDLFLQRLRPLAPGLTHIRLSELLAFDYDMVRALHSELAERGAVPARFPQLRDRQWNAEPRAEPVNWERYLPPPGTLRHLIVQPSQLPPSPEQLCGCCSGYYRVDDMTRLLREMAREAQSSSCVEEGEEEEGFGSVAYVFLPPGPRHNAYGFEEGYRDWLGRAAGERGCWKERDQVNIDAKPEELIGEDGLRSWDINLKRSRRPVLGGFY